MIQAGVMVGAGAAAAALLALQPASPSHVTEIDRGSAPVARTAEPGGVGAPGATILAKGKLAGVETSLSKGLSSGAGILQPPAVALPSLPVPVRVPHHPVKLPPLAPVLPLPPLVVPPPPLPPPPDLL